MDVDERYVTSTPEGVQIELLIAGAGSRGLALLIDELIIFAVVLGLGLIGAAVSNAVAGSTSGWFLAVIVVLTFVGQTGYFIVAEVWFDGRTPGKRTTGIKVVNIQGGALGFRRSLIRNVLRLVDSLPTLYLVGMLLVIFTPNHQRLGDMAAGTLVVRYRPEGFHPTDRPIWESAPGPPTAGPPRQTPAYGTPYLHGPPTYGWDVSAVTADELAVVRQFLWRANELPPEARWRIALDLATRLWPKVAGQPPGMHPEAFIYQLSLEKLYRR